MNRVESTDNNENFHDFIMKIYIDLLKVIAENDPTIFPLDEKLRKCISKLWNTLASNSIFQFHYFKIILFDFLEKYLFKFLNYSSAQDDRRLRRVRA